MKLVDADLLMVALKAVINSGISGCGEHPVSAERIIEAIDSVETPRLFDNEWISFLEYEFSLPYPIAELLYDSLVFLAKSYERMYNYNHADRRENISNIDTDHCVDDPV